MITDNAAPSTGAIESKLLNKLTEERNLQQGLAEAQLQSLLLKQKQLKMLEAKLAALERMEMEQNLENEKNLKIVKGLVPESFPQSDVQSQNAPNDAPPSVTAANQETTGNETAVTLETQFERLLLEQFQQESSATLIASSEQVEGVITTRGVEDQADQDDQEALMQEMINNPEFRTKISQLQRQSQELAYLEEQLASLKELKTKMMEKQQLMAEITQEQVHVLELEGKVGEEEQDQVMDQTKAILENQAESQLTVESVKIPEPIPERQANDYSELEAATEAMEKYLDMQSTARQNGREPSSDELATEAVALEHLMQRLMNASTLDVVDSKSFQDVVSVPPTEETAANQEVAIAEKGEESEEDDDEDGLEISKTAAKIDSAIQQISVQLQEVQNAESLISTPEERTYYDSILLKLTEQLEELLAIREKIQYYQEVISLNQEEELAAEEEEKEEGQEQTPEIETDAAAVEGIAIAAENPTLTSSVAGSGAVVEDQDVVPVTEQQTAIEVDQGETMIHEAQVRAVASHKSNAASPVEGEAQEVESIVIPSSSSYVPFPTSAGGLRSYKPAFVHSATPSVTNSKISTSNSRSKKLFEKHRSAINQQAQVMISSFEDKPHFLLSLFKKVQSLSGSDVSQQQLLILLDELIEETQMEDSQDGSFDEDALYAAMPGSSSSDRFEHVHVAIQTFITSLVIGSSSVETYTPTIVNEIVRHVCSLLYTELTSSALRKPVVESDAALEVIDQFKPVLQKIVGECQGRVVKDSWMTLVDKLTEFTDLVLDFNQ